MALDGAHYTFPRDGLESFRRGNGQFFLFRPRDDGRCEGVLAPALQARGKAQQGGFVYSFKRHHRHEPRLAFGERAGLVHDEGVHFLHGFQSLGIADQHTRLGARAGADHDGHGRGQSQGAGASDDEHRHGIEQRVGEARLRSPEAPYQSGQHRRGHHARNKPG